MKFLCEQCKAKYQIADEKAVGKTVRMKCRKCGHLIEVRAAVTESSVSSAPPPQAPAAPPLASGQHGNPSPPGFASGQKPPALLPRPATLAAGPPPRTALPKPPRPPGALEGAFKSAVQHDNTSAALPRRGAQADEGSAPLDMPELSASDEWYVAINGVPVGPIRVAEVRRKAALGAVTEDALVWQEGLDEWRPLRSFPELAASVREAMTRLSRPPQSEMRRSTPPPPPRHAGRASLPAAGGIPRGAAPPPPRLGLPPSVSPRSNVVPFTSRLATAAKLEEPLHEAAPLPPGPLLAEPEAMIASVAPDPFGSAPIAAPPGAFTADAELSSAPPAAKKALPWTAIAMTAAAIAFGVTTAVVIFTRPATSTPSAATTWPSASALTAVAPQGPPNVQGTINVAEPAPNLPPPTIRGPMAAGAPRAPTPAVAARSLDLHSLTQNGPTVTPTNEQGSEAPRAAGQCFSEGQVQQVIGLHQVAIRRACWERNPTAKPTVNVGVSMTIGPEGSAQSVVATGDEPSVTKCIENDVRGWHFPAMGCAQKTGFSFKFVRQ